MITSNIKKNLKNIEDNNYAFLSLFLGRRF
jgi:hypothetical protein